MHTTTEDRGALAALLLAAIAMGPSACSGASSGASADDRAAQCARNGGIWRSQIAGGFCEIKQ